MMFKKGKSKIKPLYSDKGSGNLRMIVINN